MNQPQITINENICVNQSPYKHFYSDSGLSGDILSTILEWLDNCSHWKRVVTDFYSQYEFSMKGIDIPASVSFLNSVSFKGQLKKMVENHFSTTLSGKIDVVAHKLVPGDIIGIHNDFLKGRETHRVLIHVNQTWKEECGGYFMVFSDNNPDNVVKVLPPMNGHMCGFEISSKSYHAVSKVHKGNRCSIIYSFYGAQ